ncbi:carbon-nitrogen hydrolase family protein [Glycomyces terrestris]|uniref:Carbon-nitrogen hydrolase family protein n=1 Tax=Glycomyces terrestris TaxID=2493553 RepID=A0A426URT0_9ACTN|nr:nitrilase-related carbon-nitrogen hydrolase [Glycomyces terrestris]RRR95793.1 carbon-nitrogen hydrolase family protein [Glycomyces terrestris]
MDAPSPKPPLTIALAQPDLRPGDVAGNAAAHAAAVRAAGARVVVFPELSLSSYAMAAPTVSLEDPALEAIVEACEETGTVALAGAPLLEGGREYIATVRFDADGPVPVYRKMFPGEAELERFAPGGGAAAVEVDGWRLGLAVCRDSGLDAHIEATAALGVDAYVGGNLHDPEGAARRDARMPKLAAAHGLWVAMCCFAGPGSDYPDASGGSAVWAPDGSLVAQADDRPGRIVTAVLT